MPDRLTRRQLAIITHNDARAVAILEDLFDSVISSTPADLTALTARVTAVEVIANAAYSWGNHALGGYLTDAASDGVLYGRKNGVWAAMSMNFDDNERLFFGTDDDSAIWYDGIDMYVDPKVLGGGRLKTNEGSIDVGETGVLYANKLQAV